MQLELHSDSLENRIVKSSLLLPKYTNRIKQGLLHWTGVLGLIVFAPLLIVLSLPLISLTLLIAYFSFPKFSQRLADLNKSLLKEEPITWEELEALEKELSYFERKFSNVVQGSNNIRVLNRFYRDAETILVNISELQATLRSKHTLSSSAYFDNEEELKEYLQSIEGLDDVWDYPTTQEDYKAVFDSKK